MGAEFINAIGSDWKQANKEAYYLYDDNGTIIGSDGISQEQDGNSSNGPASKLPIPPLSYLSKVRIDQTGH